MAGCPITDKGKALLDAVKKERKALAILYTAKDVVAAPQPQKTAAKGAHTFSFPSHVLRASRMQYHPLSGPRAPATAAPDPAPLFASLNPLPTGWKGQSPQLSSQLQHAQETAAAAGRSPAPPAISETVDPALEMARAATAAQGAAPLDAQALGAALHGVASEIYEELSGEVGADGAETTSGYGYGVRSGPVSRCAVTVLIFCVFDAAFGVAVGLGA